MSETSKLEQRVEGLETALRHMDDVHALLRAEVAELQSQLAWTPVSAGLPTEPGLYVFHTRGTVNLFTVDSNGALSQHLDEGNDTWDAASMGYWQGWRRIELPEVP